MAVSDKQLRAYFDRVSKKRGIDNYYDRFERDTVDSGGIEIHLDIIEVDRARPTVVFMPGTNAYALIYGEFLVALAGKGFNIVGFDPRGHGRSGGERGSYTIPELLADLRAAVEYARKRFDDPIAVAGSSQGGITAFYLAASGDPVAGVVCHNLADLGDPASVSLTRHPAFSRLMKPLLFRLARIMPEFKVPMSAYLDLKKEQMRGLGNTMDVMKQDPLLVPFIRLKGMASLAGEKLPRPVEDIKTPVMIIHGENDYIFPRDYVENIYRRLGCKKRLEVYTGLQHYIVIDHIDAILPDIVDWLEDICG